MAESQKVQLKNFERQIPYFMDKSLTGETQRWVAESLMAFMCMVYVPFFFFFKHS